MAIVSICGFILAGCAGNTADQGEGGQQGIYRQNQGSKQLHVNNHEPDLYNPDMKDGEKSFGYVRHQRIGVMGADQNQTEENNIDREQIANMISKLGAQVPNVDDVSTLVTDEEVLIIYQTDSNNINETADQVKKMAMSVVPRWFHVYVSDDTKLRQSIENFATLNTHSRDIDTLVDGVVKQMLKSPQGENMGEAENENGETQDEERERMTGRGGNSHSTNTQ